VPSNEAYNLLLLFDGRLFLVECAEDKNQLLHEALVTLDELMQGVERDLMIAASVLLD
jgi:hypothetical protein